MRFIKRYANLLIFFLIAVGVIFFISQKNILPKPSTPSQDTQESVSLNNKSPVNQITVIAQSLDTPWAIAFLPDKSMLFTQRNGEVRLIDENGKLDTSPVATLKNVREIGEGGLLGIAVHPNFSFNNYIYFYYTYRGSGDDTLNRVVRMIYKDEKLSDEQIILDRIPGASNHNGGRIKFGPDNFLYIGTGDAQNSSQAQDKNSLAGKILRTTDEGKPVPQNPFGNLVFSLGHRNVQGLAFDKNGNLWATEHGQSATDELNIIESGKNYGWPESVGDKVLAGTIAPVLHSGRDTWAPSGAALVGNSLFFAGLRGNALYEYKINEKKLIEHFKGQYGRLREVVLGPDNMLYITTSNRDGRGNPENTDDRIIKINPLVPAAF